MNYLIHNSPKPLISWSSQKRGNSGAAFMSICPLRIQTHDNVSHIPKDPILLYLSTRETCIRIAPLSIQQIQSTSKDIQKKIPERRIFSQHVPGGTLDSMAVHRRIITNTMNRKSCRAFFCPLDRSHSFFLLLLSSFNHPSFSCGGIDRPFSRSRPIDWFYKGANTMSWFSGRCGKKVATFCGTCASIVFVLPPVWCRARLPV